jgi:hypothetical protein
MTVYWAHIDTTGQIISWGQCSASDLLLQTLPDGLTAVARPDHVTGYDGWRYINNQWTQINSETYP